MTRSIEKTGSQKRKGTTDKEQKDLMVLVKMPRLKLISKTVFT